MIAGLVAGQAAIDIEELSDERVIDKVMGRMRMYHKDRQVPDPLSSVVTRWGQDPWTRGSYSSVPPGCAGSADYQDIAANVDGRVFFGGEASSYRYPAQMHGAYDSGLREVCFPAWMRLCYSSYHYISLWASAVLLIRLRKALLT
jgi:monoamine oxidase